MSDGHVTVVGDRSLRAELVIGVVLVSVIILLGLAAPWIAPCSPVQPLPGVILQAPNRKHLFGTDINGLDVFSRTIYAPRVDFVIAVAATLLSGVLGVPLALLSGWFQGEGGAKGFVSEIIMRVADVAQAFPAFILGLALASVMASDITGIVLAIAFVNAPFFLRLVHAEVLTVRELLYVEAARCVGVNEVGILFKHVLPNALGPAFVAMSPTVGWSILLTAGLSFVGAGVEAPTPEWGSMIAIGARDMILGRWWTSVFPGLFLTISVVGFALVSEGLERHMLRRRRY